MPHGKALIIGLNRVNPDKYAHGWTGVLNACEADANDIVDIARSKGFEVKTLITEEAKRQAVIKEMNKAAKELESGNIFLLYYSGHGSWLPDVNGDEDDEQDETWCLYDGEIIDDELRVQYSKFAKGVRIVVFSDSCHSGTVIKGDVVRSLRDGTPYQSRVKAMPDAYVQDVYERNKEFYDGIQKATANLKDEEIEASILLISGCQDWQQSRDGDRNSLFTSKLRTVWNDGKFKGNYQTFHKKVRGMMPKFQEPNLYQYGSKEVKLEKQRVLSI
jgi:hypothetical protein